MSIATVAAPRVGLHVAIIMDGNGRWAISHARDRREGHRAGADNVRRIVEAAPGLCIRALTLYAFSRDNWARPEPEVKNLMALLREFLDTERERCVRDGVRIQVIGSRQRLDYALLRSIASAETATAKGQQLDLRIAIDYSSRDAILAAAKRMGGARLRPSRIQTRPTHCTANGNPTTIPNVDLLIRTGGEQRLSDFLLWECAYAELYFTPVLWPDFSARDLKCAIDEFNHRERRFGKVGAGARVEKDYWLR
ncbi:MAG: di-trans,poly-cis-decaprenylcistransferase [Candidatus Hydrogenedentes bacterium]|nr:di-trans,poly-cis-decaprenylcistransferase [Candidatus Hydrogenedentota bacterium]